MKKIIALVMAMALMTSSFTACQKDGGESSKESKPDSKTESSAAGDKAEDGKYYDGDYEISAPGEFPIVVGDKATISVFTAPHTDANSDLSYGVNDFSTYFEDLTNVHIDWKMTTKADKTSKLNMLFQTDDYPDVILSSGWSTAMQYSYGEQGFLIPLNEYYDTQAYYFDQFVKLGKETGQVMDYQLDSMVMPDGNIYSIYSGMISETTHTFPYKMFIYQPWLDALKLDMPTTTDELRDVLEAFKNDDPNGNGINDEVPMAGSTNGWNSDPSVYLANAFTYYSPTDLYLYINEEDKMTLSYADDGFLDFMKYLRGLMDDGLLYEDTYVQDNNTLKTLTTVDPQLVGVVPCAWQLGFTSGASGVKGDWTNYVAIPPLKGPDGVQYTPKSVSDPVVAVNITSNCKTPIIAFKLFDALYDDVIGRNCKIGMEGDRWIVAEEGTKDIYGGQADFVKVTADIASKTNYAWGALGNSLGDSYPNTTYVDYSEDDSTNISIILGEDRNEYMEYQPEPEMILPPILFNEEDSAMITDLQTTLDECFDQFFVDMLYNVASDGLDARWEQFEKDLDARGLEMYLEIYQKGYEEQYK